VTYLLEFIVTRTYTIPCAADCELDAYDAGLEMETKGTWLSKIDLDKPDREERHFEDAVEVDPRLIAHKAGAQ